MTRYGCRFRVLSRRRFLSLSTGKERDCRRCKKGRMETSCIKHGLRHRKLFRRVIVESVGNGARAETAPGRQFVGSGDRGRKRGAGHAPYTQEEDRRATQRVYEANFSSTVVRSQNEKAHRHDGANGFLHERIRLGLVLLLHGSGGPSLMR